MNPPMPKLHMTRSDVRQALMDCGFTDSEARKALVCGSEIIPPHPHTMHTKRRWLCGTVRKFCENLNALR